MLLVPTLLCPKPWNEMSGDETRRFCSYCKRHVHNLAALSANERLALLTSPAAEICSRYKAAVRRPVKGKEASYMRHLLKYGAGVALTGSLVVVLWELHAESGKAQWRADHDRYRLASGQGQIPMPTDLYQQHEGFTLGRMSIIPHETLGEPRKPANELPTHIDITLDFHQVDQLIRQSRPASDPKKSD